MSQLYKNERYLKILSISTFVFIFLTLIIIFITPQTKGYELSIYDEYPWYFWILIIMSIFFGLVLIIHDAIREKKSNWWLIGFIIIIISDIIFLAIPFFRGYVLYGKGDTLEHIGWMKDILSTGYFSSDDFYPIIHIIGVEINYILNVSLNIVVSLIYIFFSFLYLINIYLLASVIGTKRGQTLLIVAFSSPLIFSYFHVNIHPAVLSIFMIPLLLYFYHKIERQSQDKFKNTLLLLLLIILITFFHPIVAIYTIVVLLTFGIVSFLYNLIQKFKVYPSSKKISIYKKYPIIALIMFIVVLFWYFSYSAFLSNFTVVLRWLFTQGHTPLITNQISNLVQAHLQPFQIVELFINLYGAIFLYLIISTGIVILILKKSLSKNNKINDIQFTYAIQFIISILIGLILFIGYFIEYEPIRVARFSILMGTILLGLVFYDLVANRSIINSKKKKTISKQFLILIILIILTSITISIFNVYNSPRIARDNQQVTAMEITGIVWLGKNQDQKIPVVLNNNRSYIKVFTEYIYGKNNPLSPTINVDSKRLPSHFGYNINTSIDKTFNYTDKYFMINKFDELAYLLFPKNVQEKAYQWNKKDFTILESDPAASQLYTNGDFSIWRAYGS